MNLFGMLPAKNESWCIGLSSRAALKWCDHLVVMNHASTDDTQAILEAVSAEHPGRVTIIQEHDPIWHEMAYRQQMLEAARAQGATHLAMVDADEVLTGNWLGSIRQHIERLSQRVYLLVPMHAMWRSPFQYRTDQANCFARGSMALAFQNHPRLCWVDDNGYDFHHREPYNSTQGPWVRDRSGGVMHLQFADWPRIVAKHALYKMTEVTRWPGRRSATEIDTQYSNTLREGGLTVAPAPAEWWAPYADLMQHLRCGETPWQIAACKELWKEHGPETFEGLDLYGIV